MSAGHAHMRANLEHPAELARILARPDPQENIGETPQAHQSARASDLAAISDIGRGHQHVRLVPQD
jgi:hypothetical protein